MSSRVIQFTASWCGPCQTIESDIIELSKLFCIPVMKIDVDDDKDNLVSRYEVKSIPHLVFLRDEEVVSIVEGAEISKIKGAFEKIKKNQIILPKLKEAELKNDDCGHYRK